MGELCYIFEIYASGSVNGAAYTSRSRGQYSRGSVKLDILGNWLGILFWGLVRTLVSINTSKKVAVFEGLVMKMIP